MLKKILMGLLALTVLSVAGLQFGGIIHLWGKSKPNATAEVKPEVPPVYFSLDPPFVVNFTHRGTLRYLQVSLDLSYHDVTLLAKVKEHMPAIRNDLILLFSNQDYEKLASAEGKEHLREEIFNAVNRVIGVEGLRDHSAQVAAAEAAAKPADAATTTDTTAPVSPSGPTPDPATPATPPPAPLGEVYITNFVMQ